MLPCQQQCAAGLAQPGPAQAQDLPVYTTETGTLDDAREYAAAFFARFGTEIDSEDLYNELSLIHI